MKTIEEQLEGVNQLIEENKRLQKKYPNRAKELEIGLQSLMELRKEMQSAILS